MNEENGFWIDDNNNKWKCSLFSEDEATIKSSSLTGCSGCSGCSDCSDCSGCSGCSDCSDCYGLTRCYGCSDCSDLTRCSDCYHCSDCYRCSDCSDCSDCSGLTGCSNHVDCKKQNGGSNPKDGYSDGLGKIPKIENIHEKVLSAASEEGAFDMSDWHPCETTHCRAGWVVHLAGKAGYDLEKETSCCFAAMQIYKASSEIKVSPVRFFDKADKAMDDMNRCAELERTA